MTVAAYEAALWPLRRTSQHVLVGTLRCGLTSATTAAVGRAPFSVADVAAWSTLLPEILDKAATALCLQASPAMALDVVESHFSVASVGTSNDVTPAMDAGAIGTLLVVLPSAYTGGSLAWTLGATTTTLEPTTEVCYAVVPLGAVSVSAPITSGTRLVLVFDIVRRHPSTRAILLSSREGMLAELTRIASTPMLQDQRIAHVLTDPVLAFETLGPADAAIVDVLLATQRFDVALVEVEVFIRSCHPHPSCKIPDVVVTSLVGKGAHRFLGDETESIFEPKVALLFWPTQYRAGIVGLAAAVLSAEPTSSSYLGLGSVRDLLLGTLGIFARAVLPASEEHRPFAFLPHLCHRLLAYGDTDLIDVFVSDVLGSALRYYSPPSLTTLAELVRICLTSQGWHRLGGAVQRLVARWAERNSWLDLPRACQLLASFAGVTNDPLCAALDVPFVGECMKVCFDVICTRPANELYTSRDVGASCILLDMYLDALTTSTTGNAHAKANWLDGRVPLPVIAIIDDYLYVRQHRVSTLLRQCTSDVDTLRWVPAAVLQALKLKPALAVEVYVDAIVSALDTAAARSDGIGRTYRYHLDPNNLRDILSCTTHRCSRRLLDAYFAVGGVATVHVVFELVQRQVLAPSRHDIVAGWALSVARVLIASDYRNDVRAVVAVTLTKLLAIVAPEAVAGFLTSWAAALPATLRAHRDHLYAALEQLHALLDAKHRPIFVQLAAMCQDALVAGGALDPIPDLPDFVYDDIPVDRLHCRHCAAFAAFLADGAKTKINALHFVCRLMHNIIDANADRLEKDRRRVVTKVPQPGHATLRDLTLHRQQQSQRAADRKMVTALRAWIAGPSTGVTIA
ncbi:hypothetical protein SPRG_15064 [Saprolegnia parasitica CBS 223.65]|uniref:Uncharacterized protein n=1 Tax=Saprolegnia parasitica (strain CBS 223.65) TaxID=695850 RepID=A0A067BMQ4_SAPPC|nr:hypothetical protein SPRG_15064 [Saprolegnia parasitica CBS 223.65]KDO19734.1 hypothetical protein SPRG_15064 [Saprolegnia parasitica CBS 223.65]|eukprot:XP_012209545.1 hypothetical protein SPRG_15064 [Saprolegnia parasitica CBS 223.65]